MTPSSSVMPTQILGHSLRGRERPDAALALSVDGDKLPSVEAYRNLA
jgi:hypothetical protein